MANILPSDVRLFYDGWKSISTIHIFLVTINQINLGQSVDILNGQLCDCQIGSYILAEDGHGITTTAGISKNPMGSKIPENRSEKASVLIIQGGKLRSAKEHRDSQEDV